MASLPPVDFSDILLPICEYSTSLGGSRGICDVCEPPLPKVQSHSITLTLQGYVWGGGRGLRGKGRGIRCSWAG